LFFVYQAEVGIRAFQVTGVQTCALPIYAASSRLGRAQIPYRLRERSEPDLRRRVIALRSATGFRPTKVLVANQHSGRDTRSTALGAKGSQARTPSHPGRVLLRFEKNPGLDVGESRFGCRSTALGAKRESNQSTFAPGAGAPTVREESRFWCRRIPVWVVLLR